MGVIGFTMREFLFEINLLRITWFCFEKTLNFDRVNNYKLSKWIYNFVDIIV
jgi:hypothetical protein